MTLSSIVISVITFSVLISNIVFVIASMLFILSVSARAWIIKHISQNIAGHTFIFSLLATIGSLLLSNIVGFPPCELCWFQRIVMYPQVIISLTAWIRKETSFIYYSLPLSITGFIISGYQSYIQWGGTNSILPCTLNGGECGKLYIYAYNYITIPFMAFSMFVYLLTISIIYIFNKSKI